MYESSGSQFFRTTTVIQLGPDFSEKSRSVMNFSTFLGVIVIFCSFKLVVDGKAGKEIPESSKLKFLEKIYKDTIYRRQHLIVMK